MHGKRWLVASAGIAVSASMLLWNKGCDTQMEEAGLEPFESCADLETYIEDMAVEELTWDDPGLPQSPTLWFLMFGCAENSMDGGYSDDDGGNSYSSTNLQEFNVDEADFVKNDGDYLYIVHGQYLRIVAIWPPVQMQEESKVQLEGYPIASYLDGDSMAVLSFLDSELTPEGQGAATLQGDVTKVTLIDISDRLAPRVIREVYVEGRLQDSRRIEDELILVLYRDIDDILPDRAWNDSKVEEQVRDLTLDDWLPRRADNKRKGDGAWDLSVKRACDCTRTYRPNRNHHVGFTSVVKVDLADPDSEPVGTSVVADPGTVYASEESLYLAVEDTTTGPGAVPVGAVGTRVHKFDLDDGTGAPGYAASNRLDGRIAGQFSMDEVDGLFRIATTRWTSPNRAVNGLFVMEENEGLLEVVGGIDEFAPEEEIYSVRFFDDRAYVVTFPQRETVQAPDYTWELANIFDPLFTIDLRNPREPQIIGELEVTGYSKYLHPLDQDHLLAVGEEVDPDSHEVLGFQVSLFDVSDFDSPQLQDRVVINTGWDASAALTDHHAFNYYAPLDLLAVPVLQMPDAWSPVEGSYLEVFRVTAEDGIDRYGRMDASPLIDPRIAQDFAPYCAQLRRSVIINDVIYGVGAGGVIAADYDTPWTSIAIHHFPDHGYCDTPWDSMDVIW